VNGHDEPNGRGSAAGASTLRRYGVALALCGLGIAVTLGLYEWGSGSPYYAPLIGLVALASWYGGVGPGLLVVAVGWATMLAVVSEPRGKLQIGGTDALVEWTVAAIVAVIVVGTSEVLRVGRRRATTVAEMAEADVRRLSSLNELAAALTASVSSTDVARALTTQGAKLLQADGAAVGLIEGEELVLVEPSGMAQRLSLPAGRLSLHRGTLLTRAVESEALVQANGREELKAAFPDSAQLLRTARSAAAAPLRAAGEVVGALEFVFQRDGAVGEEEAAFVATMAGLAEQALERARLYERERDTRQALDRILQVAPSFRSDTAQDVAAAICHEARTTFGADYGVLWRLRDGRLRLIRIDPVQESLPPGREWPIADFPGLARAVGSLAMSFVPDVLEEARGGGLELVHELGIRSSLRTPILVGGRAELVLSLSWQVVVSEPDRSTLAIVRRFADQAALALEELERRRAEADAARRAEEMRRLQEVTAALSLAATPLDVSNTCLEHALRTVGADAGFVVLTGPDGTTVDLVTSSGYTDDELEAWRSHGLDADVPFARAIASGEPVWAPAPEEMEAFAAAAGSTDAGWVSLPLKTRAGVRGALHLSFRRPRELTDAERGWLQTLVSQCALAFERSRLYDDEQLLRGRAERAQSLTAALSNALTRTDVAEAAVEHIGAAVGADGAALAVVLEDRQLLRVVASRGYAEDDVEPWREVSRDERTPGNAVVRMREPAFYASRADLREQFPSLDEALLPPGHESLLFVPLVAGRRANGVLTLSWSEAAQIPDDELRHVRSLVSQAAQALDRATHFESEQTIAETLQRSVLPVSLPRVDGVQLAARYLPGTAELDVGGDWFDAMPLPDGRLGLVVGDVVGKGVFAAASMSQLRNALRAFSVDRLKPASALARLNRLADEVLETTFATIAYVVVDPRTRICRIASAGHPPPLVAHADGRVELLEGGRGLPLGTGIDSRYRQDVVTLPAGSTLLLYSDGLVERRGRSIDDGLRDLCDAARGTSLPPEDLLEHVVERLVGEAERGDDIALLAARFLPVAPERLELNVSGGAGSLGLVRDAMRVWLDGAPLERADSEAVLLAVWEACANAVEHAVEPEDDIVRVRASLDDAGVSVVVEDSGRWRPPAPRPARGLGLRLMRAVASSVDVDVDDDCTRVTIEKATAGADGSRTAR
jgi:serine phosphatase RsbU (regulator of sigma subunit)/anti-sigma regulatory factor (Ser/Thr protein kinase)